jgi:hypothetical protein
VFLISKTAEINKPSIDYSLVNTSVFLPSQCTLSANTKWDQYDDNVTSMDYKPYHTTGCVYKHKKNTGIVVENYLAL